MKPLPSWLTGGLSRSQWLALLAGVLAVAVLNLLLSLFAPSGSRAETVVDIIAALLAIVITPYLLRTLDTMQRQVTRQNSELRSLHAIDAALTARLDLAAILDIAVKEATRAVDGELGALWLYDEGSAGHIQHAVFYNVSPALQTMIGGQMETRDMAWVRQGLRPVRRAEGDGAWQSDRVADLLKLRSTITVPVVRQNTVLGAFFLANRGGADAQDGFTDDDESLLTAIAATLSVAVQNARLYEETQRRGDVLRTLVARTGEAVAASSDAPRLMQILADEAARILDCPRVAVYAYAEDPAGGRGGVTRFVPLALHGVPPGLVTPQPLGIDGDLLLSGRSADAPYVASVRSALGLDEGEVPLLDSPGYLFVLRARDQRGIGLLCLLDDVPKPGLPDRDAFAQALAAQAAVGLENAALSQQTQMLLSRTRALQEAAAQMASHLDTEQVLAGVMGGARRVLDADGCALWDTPDEGIWTRRAAQGALPVQPGALSQERAMLTLSQERRTPQMLNMESADAEYDEAAPVRAGLMLPLIHAGEADGAMTLYYHEPRVFPPEDIALAQSFANHAASALQNAALYSHLNASYARERRIAETLQRNLLPDIPEHIGAFQCAQKYQAALQEAVIGGDFYDLFPLSNDLVGIVMADVSGKGLHAAVQTALVKYTLRAFAREEPDTPGNVLTRVNAVICAESGAQDGFITLFYGVLDTRNGNMTFAAAGHESPLHRSAGHVASLPTEAGLPLGVFASAEYPEGQVTLLPGDLLLLFTDGLSEARGSSGDFLGTEGLRDLIPLAEKSATDAVEQVYEGARAFADGALHDDTAILLLRRPEET